MWGFIFMYIFIPLLVIYGGLGIKFALQAAVSEKAVGGEPKIEDLLIVGAFWLPLFISDPKDFNSVEVLRVREERRQQKAAERQVRVAKAQGTTLTKQVEVEKSRAHLEYLRAQAEEEMEKHQRTVQSIIDSKMPKALGSGEEVEAEIVYDFQDKSLPLRYVSLRTRDGEQQVFDRDADKWVPRWTMIPGFRHDPVNY